MVNHAKLANNNPRTWNSIFRKLNIAGFIDHGTGTIHENEPTSAVMFQANAVKVLYTIQQNGLNGIDYRKEPSRIVGINDERKQIMAVKADPSVITHIQNPSINVQYAAVNADPLSIVHAKIKNFDYNVVVSAFNNNPNIIKNVELRDFSKQFLDALKNESTLNKLQEDTIYHILLMTYTGNMNDIETCKEFVNIIGYRINELSEDAVYTIMKSTRNAEVMAEIIGYENISKLSESSINNLISLVANGKLRNGIKDVLLQTNNVSQHQFNTSRRSRNNNPFLN